MVLQLVRTKVLAVILGPESVGVMAVIDKLLAVVSQTASLSLPFAALRFLPEYWRTDPARFTSAFRAMRNVLLGCTVVATGLALGVTALAPQMWGQGLQPYNRVIAFAVLTIPVNAMIPFLQNVVAAQMRQRPAMLIGVANAAILTLAAVMGTRTGGLVGNYSLYAALGVMVVLITVRKVMAAVDCADSLPGRENVSSTRFSPSLPPKLWKFSAAMLTLAFLTPYAALFVHYRVLSRLGPEVAGWMQATIGVSIAVRSVLGSAHAVFLTPGVNRGGTPRERMDWAGEFQSTLCQFAVVTVPLLLLFPQLAVRILYSAQFGPGAQFVALFVVGELVGLFAATYQALVVSFDHLAFHVVQNIIAQLVLVAVAALMIDTYGILGAGLAALSAQVLMYVATTTFLRWRYGVGMSGRTATLTGFALLTSLAAGIEGVMWPTLSVAIIAMKLAGYLATLSILFALLSSDDRKQLFRIASRVWTSLQPANS
jgi:PST family polysaccharide transporter